MKIAGNVGVLAMVLVLAACGGSSGTMMDDSAAMSGDAYGGSDAASASGVGDGGLGQGGEFADLQARGDALDNRVIYFDFDKAEVSAESREVLAEHAEYLARNSGIEIRLEGHADERGSREYNIGLGEARAQAVRQVLLLQGATVSQLSTVSYGEERPAALGSDEESMSLNRRVELVYAP